jgi:hypothetical protein
MKVMVEFEIEEAEGLLAVCGEVPPINFGPHAAAGRERLQQARQGRARLRRLR